MNKDPSIIALEKRYVRAERAFCQHCQADTPQIIVGMTSWTHLYICFMCRQRNRIDVQEPTESDRKYINGFYWDDWAGDDGYAWGDDIWGQGRP